MFTHDAVIPYILGLMLVITVGVGSLRFSRGLRLGPALLKETDGSGWLAAGLTLLVGVSNVYFLKDESMWFVCLLVAAFGSSAVFGFFGKGFSIHAKGIVFGMTVVFWSELEGWSWHPGKRTLLVWSRSWWVRAMSLRRVSGLNTGQAKTGELEALLERFAGGAKRCV